MRIRSCLSTYPVILHGAGQVREQQLTVMLKIMKAFDRRPMYFMRELDKFFLNQAM